MRPELFKATVAGVPFVDVVTTMLGPTIPLTTTEWEEWGDPWKEEFYFYRKSYSPVDIQVFANIMNRDITWPKIPKEMSYEAYDLINNLLTENPAQRLGAIGAVQVDMHHFFKNIHWDTLARQKATFIPSAKTLDTSYFMSWSIWNPEDEQVDGGNDFDDMFDIGCTFGDSSFGNMLEEEVG
ncbi:unnamed protein product [Lactuca saligna]|uniref:Prolyl endopeptidase-like n=1 Tax=Lactuca saligna TaxID=75948 RepID=A0AA35VNB9_LACSI|nr:unnamed protein product [Lactuca saligna]